MQGDAITVLIALPANGKCPNEIITISLFFHLFFLHNLLIGGAACCWKTNSKCCVIVTKLNAMRMEAVCQMLYCSSPGPGSRVLKPSAGTVAWDPVPTSLSGLPCFTGVSNETGPCQERPCNPWILLTPVLILRLEATSFLSLSRKCWAHEVQWWAVG